METKVKVELHFRNGNGNYLRIVRSDWMALEDKERAIAEAVADAVKRDCAQHVQPNTDG